MRAGAPLLVLAHGWGLDPSIWDGVCAAMAGSGELQGVLEGSSGGGTLGSRLRGNDEVGGELEGSPRDRTLGSRLRGDDEAGGGARGHHAVLRVDLGFTGDAPSRELPADRPLIGVGHSLGFAWLLRQPVQWRGLVSINGFARLTSAEDFPHGVAPRVLDRMRAKLQRDPRTVSRDFLRRCGVEEPEVERLAPDALAEGLDWLASWDLREALGAYDGPLLALAGAEDPIVPAQMSRETFPGGALQLVEGGGHLLPLSHPERCAEALGRFLGGLR